MQPDISHESDAHAKPVESKDYYTVMIHFYRGELGRAVHKDWKRVD